VADRDLGFVQSGDACHDLSNFAVIKGGRQRMRFQASSNSSATSESTPCHSKCPVSDAIVELR
jgi:hypothetical protein